MQVEGAYGVNGESDSGFNPTVDPTDGGAAIISLSTLTSWHGDWHFVISALGGAGGWGNWRQGPGPVNGDNPGRAGRDGGRGGDALIELAGANLGVVDVQAMARGGSGGRGEGGQNGGGDAAGGAAGEGGRSGDGTVRIEGNTFVLDAPKFLNFMALASGGQAGAAGVNGAAAGGPHGAAARGANGGSASSVISDNIVTIAPTATHGLYISWFASAGGGRASDGGDGRFSGVAGGRGGDGGDAVARISGNRLTGGEQTDYVVLMAAAFGGRAGQGGLQGGSSTARAASGSVGSAAAEIVDNVIRLGGGDDLIELGGLSGDAAALRLSGNSFDGGAGYDTLSLRGAGVNLDFTRNTIVGFEQINGSDAADTITGAAAGDNIDGKAGDDRRSGGGGADTLDGGAGADRLDGADGDDVLTIDSPGDVAIGGAGRDTIFAVGLDFALGEDAEDLGLVGSGLIGHGNGGANLMVVYGGGSTLLGGGGADTLVGSGGDDALFGQADDDRLHGEGGNDRLFGDAGADALHGGAGEDVLSGGDGADALFGGDLGDLLVGGDGDDRLYGDDGGDLLIGGVGADLLVGGAGGDCFVFASPDDSRASAADLIADFTLKLDLIDLSGVDADSLTAGDQAFVFVDRLTGAAGEATLIYDQAVGRTAFSADIDGDGVADFLILLNGQVGVHDGFVL